MSEEEIIKKANLIIENHREIDKMMVIEMVDLVQGLLDLYNKEKEKNYENKRVKTMNNIGILEEFIDKQKSNKGTFVPTDFEITAIENLIQENKKLKEKK